MSRNIKKTGEKKPARPDGRSGGDFEFLDQTLRPSRWDEYIGQENIKKNLQILLGAAKEREHPPEHLLFYGPPGLGKTTLAHLIAKEATSQMKSTSGPAIEKVGDLASILTNLSPGDILFIDEIHRLNKTIEEVLYPAMESRSLDIILGKGPSARTIQLELPAFTLIGATTRVAMISSPLRSRFSGGVFRLEFYTPDEIMSIIERSAKILGVSLNKNASRAIAERSRFTPRTANYLLKRARDYAQINKTDVDERVVDKAFNLLGIDNAGLNSSDIALLKTIAE
ncbi:MAG: Holliday junction branch migration DNA helicase RuvB, partial [Parcubacteria group bacterium]|nr:Holliday junction branch migration DNA helicase RuvB [Parcubacteria group bacterium]